MRLLYKITLPIVIMLLVAFFSLHWLSQRLLSQAIYQERATEAQERARLEQPQHFQGIDLDTAKDSPMLQTRFKEYVSGFRDSSVFRVKIWDQRLRVVYSDYAPLVGTSELSHAASISEVFRENSNQPSWNLVSNPPPSSSEAGYGAYLRVVVPINDAAGNPHYAVEIFSSTAALAKELAMYTRATALLLAGISLLLLLGIYVLLRGFVLRPVARLQAAMGIVAEGDLTHALKSERKDEIGSLTRHFDTMRRALEDFTNQLQQSRDQLAVAKASVEHQVGERTGELRDEEARLAASIDNLPIGLMLVTSEYNVFKTNKALQHIFGKLRHAFTFDEIDHLLDGFDLRQHIARVVRKGHAREFADITFGTRLLRIFISPISGVDSQEPMIGAVVLVEDVTEARSLQRSKDEFFSIASHELRTPLTVIKGDATLLKEVYAPRYKDKKMDHVVDDIKQSATYLIGIVNEFLDMSRLEQGKINFVLQPGDISQLLRDVITEFKPTADKQQLVLTLALPDKELPLIVMDYDRVKEVTVNLVSNALKYTEKGGVTIRLDTTATHIKVSVQDTGRGIPVDSQHLLFGKFQQASNNILVRDFTRSTGLGLYISKLIISGMGGEVFLERSTADVGSVFTYTLPLHPPKSLGSKPKDT
jgi:signal transduction histidine kinase